MRRQKVRVSNLRIIIAQKTASRLSVSKKKTHCNAKLALFKKHVSLLPTGVWHWQVTWCLISYRKVGDHTSSSESNIKVFEIERQRKESKRLESIKAPFPIEKTLQIDLRETRHTGWLNFLGIGDGCA